VASHREHTSAPYLMLLLPRGLGQPRAPSPAARGPDVYANMLLL